MLLRNRHLNRGLLPSIFLVIAVITIGYLWSWYHFLNKPIISSPNGFHYALVPGTGLSQLARDFSAHTELRNKNYFILLAILQRQAHRLQAGEYLFPRGFKPKDVLKKMVEGKVVVHHITLVEGFNFKEMMSVVDTNIYLTHDLKGLDAAQVMDRMGFSGIHPEGQFFPDTYHFTLGTSDIVLLRRSYTRMREKLIFEWSNRAPDLPYKNPLEGLVVASLLEKETAVDSERSIIAGVIARRLQRKMLLQIDAAVIYGLNDRSNHRLTRQDLRLDTPYNTYRRLGLPPTPIAMPGGASLHAALHPDDSELLYFVAKGDGTHEFSETLINHHKAVRQYQLGVKAG